MLRNIEFLKNIEKYSSQLIASNQSLKNIEEHWDFF